MLRFTPTMVAVFLALSPLLARAERDRDHDGDDSSHSNELRVPSARFLSIQSAIDASQGSATIRIAPGVYHEALVIAGKRVRLEGSARRGKPTVLQLAPPSAQGEGQSQPGVIEVGAGGQATLSHLELRGGAFGIGAAKPQIEQSGPRPLVDARSIVIADTGRGIAGDFGALVLRDVQVIHTLHNGISVQAGGLVEMNHVAIRDAGKICLLLYNTKPTGEPVAITDADIAGCAGEGIYVYGNANNVSIFGAHVVGAHGGGIALQGNGGAAPASILSTTVLSTAPYADGTFGDGVLALFWPDVQLRDSTSSINARVGVTAYGCLARGAPTTVTLLANELDGNIFDIDLERPDACDPGSATVIDASSNSCLHYAPDGSALTCTAPGGSTVVCTECGVSSSRIDPAPLPPER